MKKRAAAIFACAAILLVLAGCGSKYREDRFVGKTSAEIEEEFGAFDGVGMPAGEDGLYRNCQCGYTVKAPQKGFLGASPEVLFWITFDADGIAVACEEGYRPGG
ncbi:MAG: hypothetical protein E7429_01570 [Ruminococcaceae bacterium]|nr:hypothetical protein [Oscillospiraceae bacterium]